MAKQSFGKLHLGAAFGVGFAICGLLAVALRSLFKLPSDSGAATLVVGAIAGVIAIISVVVSLLALRASRMSAASMVASDHQNAKATVTFQHIARTQADHDMIKARNCMRTAETNGGVAQYATKDRQADEIPAAVNLVLNDLELVSIGIQRGIIDCSLFRAWCESSTVTRWKKWEPYVVQLREELGAPKLFIELEKMALAWDNSRPNYTHNPESPFCQDG
jgi:Domain of unknown function (DUF4760)